jgi:RHH-type transcriptional regulator, proline utilization regulon repressor / proline dehydrogenase / delta 1-pyrroline-5-carboxylate dehydrogenase
MTKAINWSDIDDLKYADEETRVRQLLATPALDEAQRVEAERAAREIVRLARGQSRRKGVMESFLEEFGLTNQEGLALMCLAEALLRVPDAETADALIAEKISTGKWADHSGQSDSWLVNASTWGLMLTGRIVSTPKEAGADVARFMRALVQRAGEPVIRAAMMQAMRIMGEQFVLGRTISAALKRGERSVRKGEAANFSFDMLGEGARSAKDAARYFKAYAKAIETVGKSATGGPERASGISVKLSALHPRYDVRQRARVMAELYPSVLALAGMAAKADIHFTLDAEEADRLVISLEILDRLAREPALAGWGGLGLAVQAYQKRAEAVIDKLDLLAAETGQRLMVRLVKGAYWDSEIKRAQQEGRPDFPVYTTKLATDASYLTCARRLFTARHRLFPQFATHNAHTLCAVRLLAEEAGFSAEQYEFQRLHGMGEALYEAAEAGAHVRVYAPVGAHEDLLPYLVRRLLENGANTSFVNTFLDEDVPAETIVADPYRGLETGAKRHLKIPPPPALYGPGRRNAAGRDLASGADQARLTGALAALDLSLPIIAEPRLAKRPAKSAKASAGLQPTASRTEIRSPADPARLIGTVRPASAQECETALGLASAAQPGWDRLGGFKRATVLRAMGDALEADMDRLVALTVREAGKTLADAVSEVREAVDFCRFYANEAERLFGPPERLPGPAGETNHLSLHGRGVFVCISPWNFPLAIFTGQVAAALASGNAVLAKPAEQTPLIADAAVALFHAAGVPEDVLQLLPGDGVVGAALVGLEGIAGVCFTGSTEVARIINRGLAERDGPIPVLVAETGGINAMFVDTTALKEQVIDDVIVSAFGSAGQRCSALRALFLPEETADALIEGLSLAMDELSLGDPGRLEADIGPVIDAAACALLSEHVSGLPKGADLIKQARLPSIPDGATYFPPTLVALDHAGLLSREVFGPVLHVIRYDPDALEAAAAPLVARGFGLTLGVHSRLTSFAERVRRAVPAGNCYVNRTMTGAVVGVQPFGGEGLSGTGPKAGGPHTLARLAVERVVTVNISAQGGDPELLNL